MKQSKLMSWVETCLNTGIGFAIAIATQLLVFPLFGYDPPLSTNFKIALIFTVVSIARGYVLRRLFEALHIRRPMSAALLAVWAERIRQIEVEGYTAEHDEKNCGGDLAYAGAAYLRHAADTMNPLEAEALSGPMGKLPPPAWPWVPALWKPQDYRRNLVRGCALGIAELEKFDRSRKQKRRSF